MRKVAVWQWVAMMAMAWTFSSLAGCGGGNQDITVPELTVTADSSSTPTVLDSVKLSGTIEASATLQATVDPPATTDGPTVSGGSWDITVDNLQMGNNSGQLTATDSAGNTHSIKFTIVREPEVSPAGGAEGVPIDTPITATFSQDMKQETINDKTFTLAAGEAAADATVTYATAVPGTVTYDSESDIATFTPISLLEANTSYKATLSSKITTATGHALVEKTWTFTTGP